MYLTLVDGEDNKVLNKCNHLQFGMAGRVKVLRPQTVDLITNCPAVPKGSNLGGENMRSGFRDHMEAFWHAKQHVF
jgi:hypothetical protein